jgi:low temperature requirement protein LtrA
VTTTARPPRTPRLSAALREGDRVTPLELFFDLIFVLALTQCTALMAHEPDWHGLAKGMLVLGVMWWAWVGYAWLTSVIDPEEGAVRIVMFAAMAGFLIVALSIPEAFGRLALLLACAYAVVRYAQLVLFWIASRDTPDLRSSVSGLVVSTTLGVALLFGASLANDALQGALWVAAIVLDMGGPLLFGQDGWKLMPGHFAERHGLIIIIALGESVVAIGVGAEAGVDTGVVVAAVLGMAISACLWWLYFDIVALVAERRLGHATVGREQNGIARDSYSYLHLPMVAGIALIALGMKKTLGHTDHALALVPAVALSGGAALYLLAHVAFRYRNIHRVNYARVIVAALTLLLIPISEHISALATLAILTVALSALIAYETRRYADLRDRLRHQVAAEPAGD